MDFFINLGIIGILLIILGKLALKVNKYTQDFSNFKLIDKFMCYMESEFLAKINLKYGKYLLIMCIMGLLFYNTLGLLMVVITVLVFTFYLANIFIIAYKFYISTR